MLDMKETLSFTPQFPNYLSKLLFALRGVCVCSSIQSCSFHRTNSCTFLGKFFPKRFAIASFPGLRESDWEILVLLRHKASWVTIGQSLSPSTGNEAIVKKSEKPCLEKDGLQYLEVLRLGGKIGFLE